MDRTTTMGIRLRPIHRPPLTLSHDGVSVRERTGPCAWESPYFATMGGGVEAKVLIVSSTSFGPLQPCLDAAPL